MRVGDLRVVAQFKRCANGGQMVQPLHELRQAIAQLHPHLHLQVTPFVFADMNKNTTSPFQLYSGRYLFERVADCVSSGNIVAARIPSHWFLAISGYPSQCT